VDGSYVYYHYMQDAFVSDKGWGCAYRSLQTLASWLVLNNYMTASVPTIPEIQKTLVKLDDKPASFVGSSKWIGATEVCYVLDDLCGVSCRILHVPFGRDVLGHARELFEYFASGAAAPVMIGGGVLAYTLLGVRFDARSGEARFLILDPHYVGGEDPAVICGKGWCAWKKAAELFVQDAFYNFCMPLRPIGV